MKVSERPPIDFSSPEAIKDTFDYYKQLRVDPIETQWVFEKVAKPLEPQQCWDDEAREMVKEHHEAGGQFIWVPYHTTLLDPLYAAATAVQDETLDFLPTNVSVLTKPDYYDAPIIGTFVRWLYDTIPAVPLDRGSDKYLRELANSTALETVQYRMEKYREHVLGYPTGGRIKDGSYEVLRVKSGLSRLGLALRASGINVMYLPTGTNHGITRLDRLRWGIHKPILAHGRPFPPGDTIDGTNKLIGAGIQTQNNRAGVIAKRPRY